MKLRTPERNLRGPLVVRAAIHVALEWWDGPGLPLYLPGLPRTGIRTVSNPLPKGKAHRQSGRERKCSRLRIVEAVSQIDEVCNN